MAAAGSDRAALARALAVALVACGCDPASGSVDGGLGPDARATDAEIAGCEAGDDDDLDGLDDATECALGYDPRDPDMDDDGVRDGVEHDYPKACVAADPAAQRREPLPSCDAEADCEAGERCAGLDPNDPDSDGDGVGDALEDTDFDGALDPSRGETDPRLVDTDGDGVTDDQEGVAVCRPDGLAMPDIVSVPMGGVQIALDDEWGAPRPAPSEGPATGLTFDDAAAEVAGLAFEREASADVAAEARAVEDAIQAAIGGGVTGVFVGRGSTTHDGHAAVTSFFRVAPGAATSASAVRDRAAEGLMSGAPTPSGETWRDVSELYLEVTTVSNTETGRVAVLAAVTPADRFDDPTTDAAVRIRDLTNTTGLTLDDQTLGFHCEQFETTREPRADFLWLVDTSGSMRNDQQNLGRVAGQFFDALTLAGVDFRVGVFDAVSGSAIDLDSPGFAFIDGDDPTGAQQLQFQVTEVSFMGIGADDRAPYPQPIRGGEQPVAAGVLAVEAFEAQAAAGSTDPDRTLRPDAQLVTMFVTDEQGVNDDSRFFGRDTARWGDAGEERVTRATGFYTDRRILSFGLVRDEGLACPAVPDFPKCVILGTGGAFIPIRTANVEQVRVAMDRIVETVAGAASTHVFTRTPISATIRVRVDGAEVPRSRAEGFDYDGASNSIVFRGSRYRPTIGSGVVVSYRTWAAGVI